MKRNDAKKTELLDKILFASVAVLLTLSLALAGFAAFSVHKNKTEKATETENAAEETEEDGTTVATKNGALCITYRKAGTYEEAGETYTSGLVETGGVELAGQTFSVLELAGEIPSGSVTLSNVTVTDALVINGGETISLWLDDSNIAALVSNNASCDLVVGEGSAVEKAYLLTDEKMQVFGDLKTTVRFEAGEENEFVMLCNLLAASYRETLTAYEPIDISDYPTERQDEAARTETNTENGTDEAENELWILRQIADFFGIGQGDNPPDDANTNEPNPQNMDTPQSAAGQITMIGDSVMLGAKTNLEAAYPNAYIDAAESRQVWDLPDMISSLQSSGHLYDTVVIALGTNGTFSQSRGQSIIDSLGNKKIYWVNTCGESWAGDVNPVIKALCDANDNVTLIDWASAAMGNSAWFYGDGIHLTPAGQSGYADLIKRSIQ